MHSIIEEETLNPIGLSDGDHTSLHNVSHYLLINLLQTILSFTGLLEYHQVKKKLFGCYNSANCIFFCYLIPSTICFILLFYSLPFILVAHI